MTPCCPVLSSWTAESPCLSHRATQAAGSVSPDRGRVFAMVPGFPGHNPERGGRCPQSSQGCRAKTGLETVGGGRGDRCHPASCHMNREASDPEPQGLARAKGRPGCAVGGGQCGLLDLMGAVAFGAVPSAGGVQCRPLCGLRRAGDLGGPGHAGFHYTGELSLCNKLSPPWKLRTTPVIISVSTVKNLGTAELGTVFRVSRGGGQAEIFRNPGRPSGSRGCFLPS